VRILVSGTSGLVGTALVERLTGDGHTVVRLVRAASAAASGTALWDPTQGVFDGMAAEGAEAVVHLAGENVASGRWTATRRAAIRDSRVRGTELVARTLAQLRQPPATLVCASAIGVYGDRGDETLTESSATGTGFLAEVCQAWERAAAPAAAAGIRVVHLRFGVILSARGGALTRMLLPFRLGAGGRLGSGRQWMSWISLDDAIGSVEHVLATAACRGPVNAVAPQPVRNVDFTRTLARALHRPAVFPVPAFALKTLLGDMANELLLSSQRVAPTELLQTGYRFQHPEVGPALQAILDR
jgi:uncharacterized protein (TIGR01777 family)